VSTSSISPCSPPPFWASIGPLGRRTAPITAGRELLYVPAMDRTKVEGDACFGIRSLEKKKIPTKDMCLVPFVENALQKSHPSHINPTELFFRSNPVLYSFHEHCLLCLGNLFC
jgi:hypothetical protein